MFEVQIDIYELEQFGLTPEEIEGYIEFFNLLDVPVNKNLPEN